MTDAALEDGVGGKPRGCIEMSAEARRESSPFERTFAAFRHRLPGTSEGKNGKCQMNTMDIFFKRSAPREEQENESASADAADEMSTVTELAVPLPPLDDVTPQPDTVVQQVEEVYARASREVSTAIAAVQERAQVELVKARQTAEAIINEAKDQAALLLQEARLDAERTREQLASAAMRDATAYFEARRLEADQMEAEARRRAEADAERVREEILGAARDEAKRIVEEATGAFHLA